jgi:hypothetical protein
MDESSPGKILNFSLNFLPRALNFSSSRSVSFTILVKRKGFTDPFFGLLDSFNKNIKMF